jgi:PadR family transcriptional regulator PadR
MEPRGHLDGLILTVLAARPAHGYAIAQELKQRSDGVFDLPEGTIYPALHRLERAQLLSSDWSSEAGRRRRVYKLTRRGTRAAGQARGEWRTFANAVEAVMA